MTRETKLLIDMWDILHRECHKVVTEENYDAIKKSIKALEQEPCEDCISRKHLLEEIASLKESPWFKDDTNCAMAIRKEAIEIVEDLCIRKEPSVNPQEPCEDAVSRQAVLDIIEKEEFKGDAISEIEKLPSVNPQKSGWIPVSERLPEDREVVLFSTKTGIVFEGRYFDDNTNCQWYAFRDETFAWNNIVTAWMPLPEPYKAESEVSND